MRNYLIAILVLTIASCTPRKYAMDFNSSPSYQYSDPITESLFNSDERTISEEGIQKLLDGHINFPDSARVAIYNFGSNSLNKYYSSYSYNEEFLKLRQKYTDALTESIGSSDRVSKVMLMPEMMTHKKPNLVNLRESAVRLQADILIIFTIKSDIYYRYKAYRKDQAKAFATIETVLFDTRTGVIPYSNIVTREQLIKKQEGDLDIRETQKRAESEAVLAALSASGEDLTGYMNQLE